MRIAFGQIDPVIGAFEANVKKIAESYERACAAGARLLLTPELGICGYPPHDLIERPEMFERCEKALGELARLTRSRGCALAVGHIGRNRSDRGRPAENTVSILEGGKEAHRQAKTLLPTYDVFDEARYFEPAPEVRLWNCDGTPVALAVCEDLWAEDPARKRQIYGEDPVMRYRSLGARLVVSISSSPYEWGKLARRELIHSRVAKALGAPVAYANQVGANDEILFDGGSFATNSGGELLGRLALFRPAFGVIELGGESAAWLDPAPSELEDAPPDEMEILSRGLVLGIRDYFARTGFQVAIVGLSGGIDSAVVAVLAARALGPSNVLGVAMPSQVSSPHSLEDAEALARKLGIRFEVRPIKFLNATASRELAEARGTLAPIALENLQSRLRGVVLMTLSNHYGGLVLTTGNKSELSVGYCTLYGDMCGALAPIGDLYKTRVYALARHLNAAWGNLIPERSLTKAPSAELRPNQTDQDTLPPYDALDPLLESYLEAEVSVEELERRFGASAPGREPGWVRHVLQMVELSEFKRRQAAPVLRVTAKAFGIGRRIPIAKTWDQ